MASKPLILRDEIHGDITLEGVARARGAGDHRGVIELLRAATAPPPPSPYPNAAAWWDQRVAAVSACEVSQSMLAVKPSRKVPARCENADSDDLSVFETVPR